MRRLILIFCASAAALSCNALGEFPIEPEFGEDSQVPVDGGSDTGASLDMSEPEVDASESDLANTEDGGRDQGVEPIPIEFDTCPPDDQAVAVRPRISIVGRTSSGVSVWIAPQVNQAMIETIGGFVGSDYEYPMIDQQPPNLVGSTSVDVGVDATGEAPFFFFSVTRRDGTALYPRPYCRSECNGGDPLWATAVSGTPNTVYRGNPPEQKRFWLGKDGDRVKMYLMGADGGEAALESEYFCRDDEVDCAEPGPLEADAFGTAFGTVFMRDRNGFVRAWQPGTAPAPIVIDEKAVQYDDFSAVSLLRNTGEAYLFSLVDRQDESVTVYRATRPESQSQMSFDVNPLPSGTVDVPDVWRAKVVGSGDGVWHLVSTTNDTTPEDDTRTEADVRIFLRATDSRFETPERRTLALPNGELRNWDVFSSGSGELEFNASVYVSYIAGDECSVDVEHHTLGVPRQ